MARKEIEDFLEGQSYPVQAALAGLLENELPEQEPLVIVTCGDERSLLRYTEKGNELRFYILRSESPDALPVLDTVRVAIPRGAQIKLVRQLHSPRGTASTPDKYELHPSKLVAAHKTLPHERIECDLRMLDDGQRGQLMELFESWVRPVA